MIYFIPFVIKMVVEKFNNLDTNQVNAIVSSIDPNEIKKFVVRWDKIKIKLESWKKIKLKWVDTKAFQERSDRKVSKDVNLQQIITVMNSQWTKVNPEQLMKAWEFSDLKQLLDEYRRVLEQYEAKFGTLKSDVNTNLNTSSGNGITGNPQTYNAKTWFFDNAPVVVNNSSATPNNNTASSASNNNVQNNSVNAPSIKNNNTLNAAVNDNNATFTSPETSTTDDREFYYGTKNNAKSQSPESMKKTLDKKEKSPNDAVAYNYQSIYELDQSDLKNADKMGNREVIRKWARWGSDDFIDIIEVGWSNKFTKPDAKEKATLKEFFKQPLKWLVLRRDIDLFNLWNMMEKVVKEKPGTLSGLSNWQANKQYWLDNFPMNLVGYKQNNKNAPAEYMAKLSALYVEYKMAKNNEWSSLGWYTNRLLAMIDNAGGVDGKYKLAGSGLKDIVKANQDNVGEVALSDGSRLLDVRSRDGRAVRLLADMVGWGDVPNYVTDDKLSKTELMGVLNNSVLWKIPSDDRSLRTLLGQHQWLPQTFDKLKGMDPTSGSMDATLMLTEAKAFGASPAEVYNIKALAEKGKLTTKYGPISDATRLMNFFVDYNNNGKGGDAADHGPFSGAQLLANYRLAARKLTFDNQGMSPEQAESTAVTSLLQKVRSNAELNGNIYVAHVLESYLNKWVPLMDLVKQHPAMVKYVQEYIKNFAADPHALFFANGDGSLADYSKEVQAGVVETVSTSLDEQLKDIPEPQKTAMKQLIEKDATRLMQDFQQQLSTLPVSDRKYFDYVTLPSLQQNLAHTLMNSLRANPSVQGDWALGLWIAADLSKNVQLNLSTGFNPNTKSLIPGIGLWFKNDAGTLGANINATMLGAGTAVYAKLAQWNNGAKLSTSLDPLSYKTSSLTADARAGAGWDAKGAMVGAGLHFTTETDRMKGIETMATSTYAAAKEFLPKVLDAKGMKLISDLNLVDKTYGPSSTIAQKEAAAWPIRNQLKSLIREQLVAKFGKTENTELYDVATQNILNGIIMSEYKPGQPVDGIAKYLSRTLREDAINNLKGKYELTQLWVGVGVFLSPTNLATGNIGAQLSLWVSRYSRGAGAVTNAEWYRAQNRAEAFGIDNRKLNMGNDKFVDYLNGMMQDSRGMPEKDKIVPKITLSADKKNFVIPAELWRDDKNLTIKVAKGAIWRVGYDVNNNILISVSENMRMVASPELDKATYVLNIGSYTTSSDDVELTRFKDNVSSMEIDGKKVFVSPDKLDTIDHHKKTNIVISESNVSTLQSIVGPTASNFSIDGNKLLYMQDGKSQELSVNGGTINGWTVAMVNGALEFSKPSTNGWTDKKEWIPLVYEFESFKEIMSHIDTHSKQIEAWERKNDKKIKDFYEYAIANDDTKAAQQLLGMDSTIDAIIKTGTPEQKSQLVSYMTEAFAIEEREYKNKTATELMDKRDGTVNIAKHGPAYARIDRAESGGINIKNLFSRDDLKALYKWLDTKPSNTWEPQKDLIWYTAFYRKNANNKERGYAMTLPGYTRVLWGKINTFDKWSQKEADAKTWLVENLRTDTLAQQAIKDALATKDLGPVSKESIKNLTPGQLITLLTKKEWLPLDGCTLSIDATPVFYLLAECANESLGLQLKAITCKDQNGVEIKKVSTDMTEEVLDGGRMVSVTNADGQSTLGKKTVFKAAVGWSRGFGGGSQWWGHKEGDVDTNPWWDGSWDWTGWTGSNQGGSGSWDWTGNNTWWW